MVPIKEGKRDMTMDPDWILYYREERFYRLLDELNKLEYE